MLVAAFSCPRSETGPLLADKARFTTAGDTAYLNGPPQTWLATHNEVVLLTPRQANQRPPQPALLTKAINHCRQVIETINSQLAHQFGVERNGAKSLFGLGARLQAKLAAHTLGIYLNCWLGRPLLALADLTNI